MESVPRVKALVVEQSPMHSHLKQKPLKGPFAVKRLNGHLSLPRACVQIYES